MMDERKVNSRASQPPPRAILGIQHEIEQFLYFEAELLDDHRLDEWADILADDLRYFMPLRRTVGRRDLAAEWSGDNEIAYYDEDKASIELRLRKLKTGQAWAEEPRSRTRHMVTNVRVQLRDAVEEYDVKSAFLCYRNRSERQTDILVGERRDVLRRIKGGTFQIARRTILLDQATFLANNLSFFL